MASEVLLERQRRSQPRDRAACPSLSFSLIDIDRKRTFNKQIQAPLQRRRVRDRSPTRSVCGEQRSTKSAFNGYSGRGDVHTARAGGLHDDRAARPRPRPPFSTLAGRSRRCRRSAARRPTSLVQPWRGQKASSTSSGLDHHAATGACTPRSHGGADTVQRSAGQGGRMPRGGLVGTVTARAGSGSRRLRVRPPLVYLTEPRRRRAVRPETSRCR